MYYVLIMVIIDGCGTNPDYQNSGGINQKSMVATVLQTVALRAELQVGDQILSEDLWQNQMVNSWMSIVPIKYVFETESIGIYKLL